LFLLELILFSDKSIDWEKVLDKIADWELLRLYPDMLLQSAFGDFLRSRLDEKASLRGGN
jgi:hypothetical protein